VAIPLTIEVENPDELLNAGLYGAGAVIRIQSSATETGAYADVSGTGSTPTKAIVAATRSYTGYDPNGTSSTWYRVRYESSNATRVSDWTAVFQAGDETAGLLCSLYDVQQELGGGTSANEDELILEKIRQVSRQIENYCGRWFAPRPLSGTATYRFHSEAGNVLHIPRGIRSITSLGIASEDQPDTGGTYVVSASADYYIDPPSGERTDPSDPGFWVRLGWNRSSYFYDAAFGVEITGAFGWASVPYDIQGVATRASIRRYLGKGGGATVAVGPAGTEILLPDMSGADRLTLDWYKRRAIG
jgi:hypothetical protein